MHANGLIGAVCLSIRDTDCTNYVSNYHLSICDTIRNSALFANCVSSVFKGNCSLQLFSVALLLDNVVRSWCSMV